MLLMNGYPGEGVAWCWHTPHNQEKGRNVKMNNEKQTPLTLPDACTLLARETVSLLEGFDQIPDSAISLRSALALVSDEQDLGGGGSLLAWVDAEMENTKHFAETGGQTKSLVNLKTPFAMPDPAMQMDAACILLKAAAQRHPTLKQWQTVLDAVRLLAEMDDLEDMILDAKVPSGGFLSVQELRSLLDGVQAAVEVNRQEARVGPCEAASPKGEAQPPERP